MGFRFKPSLKFLMAFLVENPNKNAVKKFVGENMELCRDFLKFCCQIKTVPDTKKIILGTTTTPQTMTIEVAFHGDKDEIAKCINHKATREWARVINDLINCAHSEGAPLEILSFNFLTKVGEAPIAPKKDKAKKPAKTQLSLSMDPGHPMLKPTPPEKKAEETAERAKKKAEKETAKKTPEVQKPIRPVPTKETDKNAGPAKKKSAKETVEPATKKSGTQKETDEVKKPTTKKPATKKAGPAKKKKCKLAYDHPGMMVEVISDDDIDDGYNQGSESSEEEDAESDGSDEAVESDGSDEAVGVIESGGDSDVGEDSDDGDAESDEAVEAVEPDKDSDDGDAESTKELSPAPQSKEDPDSDEGGNMAEAEIGESGSDGEDDFVATKQKTDEGGRGSKKSKEGSKKNATRDTDEKKKKRQEKKRRRRDDKNELEMFREKERLEKKQKVGGEDGNEKKRRDFHALVHGSRVDDDALNTNMNRLTTMVAKLKNNFLKPGPDPMTTDPETMVSIPYHPPMTMREYGEKIAEYKAWY
ncbi:hypothetical protein T484DRAFT_1864246 [Baffinella frigidus]|nr:hypothetical protein T484DRAFT_1864246 [Cryptophyta sp. CCMP2293]